MTEGHEHPDTWEEHRHEAVVHSHGHFHVTHNHNAVAGGFDHLSSWHVHEHDHADVTHTHFPHNDFETEHEGEAHDHDHRMPVLADDAASVKKATPRKSAPRRRTASPEQPGEPAAG